MKHSYLVSLLAIVIIIAGCGNLDYKKTKSGLLYKIISSGNSNNPVVKENQFLKFNVITKLNDSILNSTYGKLPGYSKVVPAGPQTDYSPPEIFNMLRKGDSAITVLLVDTFLKRGMAAQLPPAAKKGDRFIITFKVLEVFTSDSLVQKDYSAEVAKDQERQQKEMIVEKAKEEKEIDTYLAANKINTQKTPKGVYVEIINPGQGLQADSGKQVSLKYKGTTFAGKIFDTNMDSSFHHAEPLNFTVGSGTMTTGFDEGVRVVKKGGKVRLFVPAVLAYGPNPVMEGGKPYENLIFEIEILDVKDKPSAQPSRGGLKLDNAQQKK